MTYELRPLDIEGGSDLIGAYSPDGGFIGLEDEAKKFVERGIVPQLRPDSVAGNSCSIGFSEAEQKWYGWSHRAMFGFGIGSVVTKGDCAYTPTDEEDYRLDVLRFWGEGAGAENHVWTKAEHGEEDGVRGVHVSWLYDDEVKNEAIRGTVHGHFWPYPKEWGRGEWTAKTLEDAKQMACDFARGVD